MTVGSLVLGAGALGSLLEGCSSSSSTAATVDGAVAANDGAKKGDSGVTVSTGDSGGGPTVSNDGSTGTTACTVQNALTIAFSPMYSAVIPGDNTHVFAVPAIVAGLSTSAVTWSASPASAVNLSIDATTGGILITMSSTGSGGPVTITAAAGDLCGSATLNITASTTAAWTAGSERYNDGVLMTGGPGMGMEGPPDGGYRYACTDCHAAHADAGRGFNDIAHTPEQTGGFSDQQLLDIIQNGTVPGYSDAGVAGPEAGYFDPTIISYQAWHRFHRWNLTTEEQTGIVTYLRSLTPTAQNGTSNFGGFGGGGPPPDGGYHFGDGGFHNHHDGGFGGGGPGDAGAPKVDATVPADAN